MRVFLSIFLCTIMFLQIADSCAEETPAAADMVDQKLDAEAKKEQAKKNTNDDDNALLRQIEAGGMPMWFLGFLSVAAMVLILERMINLTRGNIAPSALQAKADALWQRKDYEGLKKLCADDGSVLAQIVGYCAANPDRPLQKINDETGEIASQAMREHLQTNYWLAVVATLSPLLGLLGTILGMIKAFDVVAVAGDIGDVSLVAEGISQALVTTAAGLIIAVPALGFFHIFRVRANKLTIALERASSEIIKRWYEKA